MPLHPLRLLLVMALDTICVLCDKQQQCNPAGKPGNSCAYVICGVLHADAVSKSHMVSHGHGACATMKFLLLGRRSVCTAVHVSCDGVSGVAQATIGRQLPAGGEIQFSHGSGGLISAMSLPHVSVLHCDWVLLHRMISLHPR